MAKKNWHRQIEILCTHTRTEPSFFFISMHCQFTLNDTRRAACFLSVKCSPPVTVCAQNVGGGFCFTYLTKRALTGQEMLMGDHFVGTNSCT